MRRLAVMATLALIGCWLASCDVNITLVVPYCPISDSAKAKADSVPFTCSLDSTKVQR